MKSRLYLVTLAGIFLAISSISADESIKRELSSNLAINFSFESGAVGGKPPSWELFTASYTGERGSGNIIGSASLVIAAGGHSGEREAQLSFSKPIKWEYAAQILKARLAENEEYRLRLWLKATHDVKVDLGIYAMDDNADREEHTHKTFTIGPDWKECEVHALIRNGPYTRCRLQIILDVPEITVSIDDVQFTRVEP